LGFIYAWSIFKKPLTEAFGWTDIQLTWTFTICMSCFCIGGILAAQISRKIDHRYIVLLSGLLVSSGFFGVSKAEHLWQLYVFYGIFVGLSVGFVYNCVLTVGNRWFPDKPGFISGMLLMSFGFGSLAFGPFSALAIELYGFRFVFMALAFLFLAVFLITHRLVSLPSEEFESRLKDVSINKSSHAPVMDMPPSGIVRQSSFWIFYGWGVFNSALGMALMGQAFTISLSFGLTNMISAFVVSAVSISNGMGRIFNGWLYDRRGYKTAMSYVGILNILGSGMLVCGIMVNSRLLLVVSMILMGLGFGGITPTNSNIIRGFYGMKYYAFNYGIINFTVFFAVYLGQFIGSYLFTVTGTYFSSVLVMLIIALVCMFAGFLVCPPKISQINFFSDKKTWDKVSGSKKQEAKPQNIKA
jgi:OFA family oxalate/formate antiporter-like MFS transporter